MGSKLSTTKLEINLQGAIPQKIKASNTEFGGLLQGCFSSAINFDELNCG